MEILLPSGARALQLVSLTTPKLNEFSVYLLGLPAQSGMVAGTAEIRHRIRLDPFRTEEVLPMPQRKSRRRAVCIVSLFATDTNTHSGATTSFVLRNVLPLGERVLLA